LWIQGTTHASFSYVAPLMTVVQELDVLISPNMWKLCS
jgi:hypothetical protein